VPLKYTKVVCEGLIPIYNAEGLGAMELLKTFPIALVTSLAFLAWAALSVTSMPSESDGFLHYLRLWVSKVLRSLDLYRGLVGSAIFGIVMGSLAVLAAWDHNPQSVVHDSDRIAVGYLVVIWLSWFVISVVALAPWIALVLIAIRRTKRRLNGRTHR
jgi:hypothetical protein